MSKQQPRGINRRLTIELTDSLIKRFWAGVDKGEPGECWNWQRSFRNGYGAIKHQGRVLQAHRLSYVIASGEPPANLLVTHTCDNGGCCNPKHLVAGTPQQNNQEAHDRGSPRPCGEQKYNAKLNEQAVARIWAMRRQGKGSVAIAKAFDVNRGTIRKILQGKAWKHLTPGWAK